MSKFIILQWPVAQFSCVILAHSVPIIILKREILSLAWYLKEIITKTDISDWKIGLVFRKMPFDKANSWYHCVFRSLKILVVEILPAPIQ